LNDETLWRNGRQLHEQIIKKKVGGHTGILQPLDMRGEDAGADDLDRDFCSKMATEVSDDTLAIQKEALAVFGSPRRFNAHVASVRRRGAAPLVGAVAVALLPAPAAPPPVA
jgi:hypothetical protein